MNGTALCGQLNREVERIRGNRRQVADAGAIWSVLLLCGCALIVMFTHQGAHDGCAIVIAFTAQAVGVTTPDKGNDEAEQQKAPYVSIRHHSC